MRNLLPPAGAVFAACLALLLAGAPLMHAAGPIELQVERQGSLLKVTATIVAGAPADVCYAVIADFDHLADFIPDMKSSHIVSGPGQPLRLRQVGEAQGGFSRYAIDVTLALTVDPPREITFTRVDGNLVRMDGRWQVRGDAGRCTIDYRADLQPSFWVPPILGPMIMRQQVETQLEGLKAEIDRRALAHSP